MRLNASRLLLCFIFCTGLLTACKKAHDVVPTPKPTPTPTPTTGLTPQQLNDSSLIYTKDIYLWYNQIPSTFNTTTFADPSEEMIAIRQFSIEPGLAQKISKPGVRLPEVVGGKLAALAA